MFPRPSSENPAPPPDLDLDLGHLWRVARRRWRIIAAAAGLAAAGTALAVFAMRPVYEAQVLLLIEKVGTNPLERDAVTVESLQDDYYQTQYEILRSRTLAEKVVDDLKLAGVEEFRGEDPVARLRRRLKVNPVRRTRLVNVTAGSYDAALAAAIANDLAKRYVEQNVKDQQFLSKELLKILDGKSTAAHESLPAVVNSPLIQRMKGQLAELEGQSAELSGRYRPGHPQMRQLGAHIRQVKAQIDREVRHVVESVKLQLSGELKGSSVRVVDPALPPLKPAKPKKAKLILLALFLGLLAGSGAAVLVDRMDLTVRTHDDVENLLRMPCLGLVETLAGADGSAGDGYGGIWKDPKSPGSEAFRNLRAAISFRLPAERKAKVLLVTSAVMEEGKSLVAANLARAFAEAGEKVLLVDGDMRRPAVGGRFGLKGDAGLSNRLSGGRGGSPEPIATGVPGLEALPGGPVPDNPAELLAGTKIGELLSEMEGRFDRVIVDSPPVFPMSDALLLARQAHAVVFVVRAGKTRAALGQRAHQRLKDSFASVLGGVLNMASSDSLDNYGYYSKYYASESESARRKPGAVAGS